MTIEALAIEPTTDETTVVNDTTTTEITPPAKKKRTRKATKQTEPPTRLPAEDTHTTCTCNGNAPLCSGTWPTLTRRETEVLDQIARGSSYTDIAAHFDITLDTVKTTMHRIHKKLGARNSPHAVTIAITAKFICAAIPTGEPA